MIDVDVQEADGGAATRVVVQGNRSMSWRANLVLAGSLGAVCMGIAIALATQGLWLVIPFAGAEVLLVLGCLWLTLRRLSRKEVITVGSEAIVLEWGYNSPEISVRLPRQWSRLRYHATDSPFDCGDLSVAAHGKAYALGRVLNRDEKRALHVELRSALSR